MRNVLQIYVCKKESKTTETSGVITYLALKADKKIMNFQPDGRRNVG
jgi:hypothetical protein